MATGKKMSDKSTLSAITDSLSFISSSDSGTVNRVKASVMKTYFHGSVDKYALDNVFIMYCREKENTDNYPVLARPWDWTAKQNNGEIAMGVAVFEGGRCIVVAPTESSSKLTWASAATSSSLTTAISDTNKAFLDFDGQSKTATIVKDSTTSGESYAPGFCNAYSRLNGNSKGIAAGSWWLPSMGEMITIYSNMNKINYCLSLISGATQLQTDGYWTSTESSGSNAWPVTLSNGTVSNWCTKATNQYRVRPVSAFKGGGRTY
jgi:hypothetical protein